MRPSPGSEDGNGASNLSGEGGSDVFSSNRHSKVQTNKVRHIKGKKLLLPVMYIIIFFQHQSELNFFKLWSRDDSPMIRPAASPASFAPPTATSSPMSILQPNPGLVRKKPTYNGYGGEKITILNETSQFQRLNNALAIALSGLAVYRELAPIINRPPLPALTTSRVESSASPRCSCPGNPGRTRKEPLEKWLTFVNQC